MFDVLDSSNVSSLKSLELLLHFQQAAYLWKFEIVRRPHWWCIHTLNCTIFSIGVIRVVMSLRTWAKWRHNRDVLSENRLQWNGGHHGCASSSLSRSDLSVFSLWDFRQGCVSVSFFFMERNCATTLATGCSFLVEVVFHVLQIMQPSPHSLDIGQSFRGQLMEVRSVLAHCMKRESVTHYQCVQHIGKKYNL